MTKKSKPVSKHTPLPWVVKPPSKRGYRYWIFDAESNEVGILYSDDDRAKANAAYIVRAVNAHEELLAALIAVQDAMHDDMIKVAAGAGSIFTQIKQAIAKAEGLDK